MVNQKKRVTIVYLIDFLATRDGVTGGTERQLVELVNNIDRTKYRPIVISLQEFLKSSIWDEIQCEKHILHLYSLISLNGIFTLFKFVKFLRQNSVRIVKTFFYDSTLFGIVCAALAGVKIKISCRRDMGFWYDKGIIRKFRIVNLLTDRILANCNAVQNAISLLERTDPKKIDVIYNGLDLKIFDSIKTHDLFSEFSNIMPNDLTIGIVANYNRKVKRVDLLLYALKELLIYHKNLKVIVVGGGKLEHELKELANELDINDYIIFCGKRKKAISYIKAFDIAVLTSDSEGFSNVLLEYMAAGKPIIATNVGGNNELITDQHNGLLINQGDDKALSKAICYLIEHPSIAKSLGQNARLHIEKFYDWNKRIKEVEDYYSKLLSAR